MKKSILLATLVATLATAQAQQAVPRDELLKVVFMLSLDLKQMLNTPIPTDPDLKRPVAQREGEHGAMVLPESKLSADTLAKAGKEVVPVGQLWLRKLVPQCDGQPTRQDKLQVVTVNTGDRTEPAILCALGVRKDQEGKLELLVYGKDKEPLLRAPLKGISAPQENPIELGAELQGDGARLTLKLAGKYEGSLEVVSVSE
jgi:hypothetical protein